MRNVDLTFFNVLVILNGPSEAPSRVESLKTTGVPFKIVANSEEALQILEGERFDLIAIDFSSTGAGSPAGTATDSQAGTAADSLAGTATNSQTATLAAIRSSKESFRNTPVLALLDESASAEAALQAGAQYTIPLAAGDLALKQQFQQCANEIFEALPVLSEASIDKIRVFDDEEQSLLTSLFGIYSESTGADIAELEQLVKNQDFDLLRKKAHKMKSSAAQLGAFRLEKYCYAMEYDPALDQERAQKLYQEMSSEYAQSLAEFQRYLQKPLSV